MNQRDQTAKRGWMSRVGWGKRRVSQSDDDDDSIPLHVALRKISRSILEDDITLESGDVFTHEMSFEEEEDLEIMAPPCRLRQIDETRADSSCDEHSLENIDSDNNSVPRDSILQEEEEEEEEKGTTDCKEATSNCTDQELSTVPKFTFVDFTTAPLTPWVCW